MLSDGKCFFVVAAPSARLHLNRNSSSNLDVIKFDPIDSVSTQVSTDVIPVSSVVDVDHKVGLEERSGPVTTTAPPRPGAKHPIVQFAIYFCKIH